MYFPLFLPLWGIRKGNKGNFFRHCSLLYQEVLRKPALLFVLSERKYSLWYWHQNVLAVPVHLSEPLRWRAGCWCGCDITGGSENLQILPAIHNISIPLDDGVSFRVKQISEIMEDADYPGVRVSMERKFDGVITPLKIDISTGDVITPTEIKYKFNLMLEDRLISSKAISIAS